MNQTLTASVPRVTVLASNAWSAQDASPGVVSPVCHQIQITTGINRSVSIMVHVVKYTPNPFGPFDVPEPTDNRENQNET